MTSSNTPPTYTICLRCDTSLVNGWWVCPNTFCKKELFWGLNKGVLKFGKYCKNCGNSVFEINNCHNGDCNIVCDDNNYEDDKDQVADKTVEYHSDDE
jgi:hypothetical protein